MTFETEERDAVVRAAVDAAGDVPVHVAISAPSTGLVVRAARAAEQAGASGLVLAPFAYLPLVEDEVLALCEAVADASTLPVCFDNKPVQTGYDVSPDALARLAERTRVVAVKDPASLPARPSGRVAALRDATGGRMSVGLSGDVALLDGAEAADAWHTGLAALAPAEYVAVRAARERGERPGPGTEARRLWLLDVARELTTTRPLAGLHALAALLGTPTAPPRGPHLPATPTEVDRLRAVVARRPTG